VKKKQGSLSKEEKERRIKENLCLYCWSDKHKLESCDRKKGNIPKSNKSSTYFANSVGNPRPRLSDRDNLSQTVVQFSVDNGNISIPTKILVDSGSQLNLLDIYYAEENHIPYTKDSNITYLSGVGGNQSIVGKTVPISLNYGNKFYVTDLPDYWSRMVNSL